MTRGRRLVVSITLTLALAACGDNLSVAVDAGPPSPIEAPHPFPPQVSSAGGPVLASPEIVPIFFAGDDLQPQLEAFLAALATSSYWRATTGEYGVGPPTILTSVVTDDPPPTTADGLQAWLEGHLGPSPAAPGARVQLGWPRPDANTLYLVFLPAGVTLTAGTDVSCKTFGGYHDETYPSGIVYALLPRCPTTGDPIDAVTPATSHELVEAATDPHPNSAPAFVKLDTPDIVWAFTPGGELGDMCEYLHAARQRLVGGFLVQRTWSNASAAAGHDPCVPVPATPYVAAAPVLGKVTLAYFQDNIPTLGIQIPNGASATVDLDLFSDAPVADWTVGVDDVASTLQHMPAELACSVDKTTGNNGDQLHLTLRRLKAGEGGGSEFVVTSKVDGTTVSLWWGLATD